MKNIQKIMRNQWVVDISCLSLILFIGASKGAYEGCDDGVMVGDTCYIYRPSLETWSDADTKCAEMGGYIVEPRNSSVTSTVGNILAEQAGTSLWIGAHQLGAEPEERVWGWTSECVDCGKGASGCYHGAFDLAFILDESGGVRGPGYHSSQENTPSDNWWQIKQFARKLTAVFNIGLVNTLVGAVSFSNAARIQIGLTDHYIKPDLLNAIDNLGYLGQNTNTSAGLRLAREGLFTLSGGNRPGVPNIVVMVTDGPATWSVDETIPQAQLAHAAGIKVYVVGVTDEVDDNELAMMSSFPHRLDENWWKVAGFAQLNSHYQVNLVADQICKDLGGSPKRQMYGQFQAVGPQGCFDTRQTSSSWSAVDAGSNLTPQPCKERCSDNAYSGVQGGDQCSCADQFDYEGATAGCIEPCSGDAEVTCGGLNKRFVYKLGGGYAAWGFGEPNNLRGRQHCVAISASSYSRIGNDQDYQFAFIDEECVVNRGFICDIPFGHCAEAPGYVAADGWCYYISPDPTSWFGARMECRIRSGDLAVIMDADDHQRYRMAIDVSGMRQLASIYWIGLSRNKFMWTSGDYVSTYSAFFPGEPDTGETGCLVLERTGSFALNWWEDNCDAKKAFICQIDTSNLREIPTTAAMETTTTMTTMMTMTMTTMMMATATGEDGESTNEHTTSGSGGPQGPPSAGASTGGQDDGLSDLSIALIVVAIILCLILVIAIIIFVVHAKKGSVAPEPKKVYDARIYAPYPERGYGGDEEEDSFVNGYSAKTAEQELIGLHSPRHPPSYRASQTHYNQPLSTLNVSSLSYQNSRRSGGFGANYYKIY